MSNQLKQKKHLETVILPVFILPIFLLPEGHTRLRVFEPRYLKLVRIASQNNGFIIYHGKQEEDSIGSLVEIVNFEQGKDGVLIIDVRCSGLVNLSNLKRDEDQLMFAESNEVIHWHGLSSSDSSAEDEVLSSLSGALKEVFEENITLKEIYNNVFKDEPLWVVARWIEILPIKFADKRSFLCVNSFSKAKQFVHSVVFEQK